MELNGIAFDATKNEFLITGKLWPKIYRVKFF
jgi:glutamine cyclotransferase